MLSNKYNYFLGMMKRIRRLKELASTFVHGDGFEVPQPYSSTTQVMVIVDFDTDWREFNRLHQPMPNPQGYVAPRNGLKSIHK